MREIFYSVIVVYDVICVGAGPSGSSATTFLAQNGIKCLLLDRANFPREKPCGGAISPRTLIKFPFTTKFVDQCSREGTFNFQNLKRNEYSITMANEDPIMFFVRRTEFDNQLLNLAIQNGVEIKQRVRVTKINYSLEHVDVSTADGEIFRSKFLLGADGVNSIVRKCTGLEQYWNRKKLALLFTREFECNPHVIYQYYSQKRTFHTHIGFGGVMGYGWIFPKLNSVNVGFGAVLKDANARQILSDYHNYVTTCQQKNLLPAFDNESIRPLSWTLQSGGPMKKFAKGRVLLTGDAAGFVHPVSGEGILYAIWSGNIAAESILQAIRTQISISSLADTYQWRCNHEFAFDLKKMDKIHNLSFRWFNLYFKLAQHDPELRKILLILRDGTESFSGIQNKIMKRVMQGILKGNLWKSKN